MHLLLSQNLLTGVALLQSSVDLLAAEKKILERRILLAESKSLDTDAMLAPITKRIAVKEKKRADLQVNASCVRGTACTRRRFTSDSCASDMAYLSMAYFCCRWLTPAFSLSLSGSLFLCFRVGYYRRNLSRLLWSGGPVQTGSTARSC